MVLNDAGVITRHSWLEMTNHFPMVVLDEYIIMPNHVHGIIVLYDTVRARHAVPLQHSEQFGNPTKRSIPTIIRSFKSAAIRFEIKLGEFVVMPNHFHGIVLIHRRGERRSPENDRRVAPTEQHPGPKPKSIGALVAGFKSAVTNHINEIGTTPGTPVWQHNYYEHVIRNEIELNKTREYIVFNPINWTTDKNYGGTPHTDKGHVPT